ncbi:MAG: hypothetical protein P0119_19610 [Nitrospira sp.]|nr:hypothetical protein [Nitrospira sp.]
MVALTIKDGPEPLVKPLKQQASAKHRSRNVQVISYLEQMTHGASVDADALLARARAIRHMRPSTKSSKPVNEYRLGYNISLRTLSGTIWQGTGRTHLARPVKLSII